MTAARTPRPMFRVTLFREIATEHHKAWLIDDLLGAGELSAVYGPQDAESPSWSATWAPTSRLACRGSTGP